MLNQILTHTPVWVFALFAGLVALGLSQMRTREVPLSRAAILPLVMVLLSLMGTLSAFSGSPGSLFSWAAALTLTTVLLSMNPLSSDTVFHVASKRFTLPGSAVPLALMMAIFFTKYAVGAAVGMNAELAQQPTFTMGASAAYGLFSGAFLSRGLRLWRLSRTA